MTADEIFSYMQLENGRELIQDQLAAERAELEQDIDARSRCRYTVDGVLKALETPTGREDLFRQLDADHEEAMRFLDDMRSRREARRASSEVQYRHADGSVETLRLGETIINAR